MAKESQTYEIGRSRVTLRVGNLLDSQTDVIVSSDDHRLTMSGGVSKAIRLAAGSTYETDVRQEADRADELKLGAIVVTNSGVLGYKKIFHAVSRIDGRPNAPDLVETARVIERAVTNSIKLLDGLGFHGIAFPAIGTGYAKHSPTEVAATFARVLNELLADGKRELNVEIVLSDQAFGSDLSFMEFFKKFDAAAKWDGRIVRDHTVFMVHGIRTAGDWMEKVGRILREADLSTNPVPVGYGFFDVLSFLLPVGWIRNHLIDRIGRELVRCHNLATTKKLSIVAHSFGTFLIAYALKRNPNVKVNCVVLCGSVVPGGFDWSLLDGQLSDIDYRYPGFRILNDCGWRDIWPVFAQTFTWGFGSSGRFGFQSGSVKDRFHNLAHSDFFTDEFINEFWVPVIVEGKIVERKELRPKSSWWLQVLTRFHIKYIALLAVACWAWVHFGNGGLPFCS
ncbi:MAG: macro domain-containing protein [Methylotetracoccus sp.]